MDTTPLQRALPQLTCFGCGPANDHGLHLESRWSEDGRFVVATWQPSPEYNAGLPNTMYGGTIASLIDCHSMWTAMAFAYRAAGRPIASMPLLAFVTGQLTVKFLAPTPLDRPIELQARVEGEVGRKTRVLCELGPAGAVTATGDTVAVALQWDQGCRSLPPASW